MMVFEIWCHSLLDGMHIYGMRRFVVLLLLLLLLLLFDYFYFTIAFVSSVHAWLLLFWVVAYAYVWQQTRKKRSLKFRIIFQWLSTNKSTWQPNHQLTMTLVLLYVQLVALVRVCAHPVRARHPNIFAHAHPCISEMKKWNFDRDKNGNASTRCLLIFFFDRTIAKAHGTRHTHIHSHAQTWCLMSWSLNSK